MHTTTAFDCDLLLTADLCLTQDAERRVIEKAALAVKDGRITALGGRDELARLQPAKRLDLGRALLMPGLVNAHTHVSMTFLRGLADDLPLHEWLTAHIFPREQRLTADIVKAGALLGCAEMIRTGTSAFVDMYLFADAVAEAVDASGLRCLVGEAVFAFPTPASASHTEAFGHIRAFTERWRGHPRLRAAVMPHTVYTTTPEILEECRDLAADLDLPLHIHLSETRTEVEDCLTAHGRRPPALCRDLGLLGPKTSLAHCVALDDEDLNIIAAAGARPCHCPRSNMKLASGAARTPEMLERGLRPALGTDGAASNNGLNMFAEMSACALLHKVTGMNPTLCPAQSVLDMATLHGAEVFGLPGSLAKGAPADLIALDLTAPNMLPEYNPASHLVYAASGHEVRLTMVAGNILYQDGNYLSLDYPALVEEADALKRWVKEHL